MKVADRLLSNVTDSRRRDPWTRAVSRQVPVQALWPPQRVWQLHRGRLHSAAACQAAQGKQTQYQQQTDAEGHRPKENSKDLQNQNAL